MGRTTLVVDASAIKDTLVGIVTDGFDKAFKHMTTVNDKAFAQLFGMASTATTNDKAITADISGLREQIIANVQVLLPIIGTTHGMSFKMGNHFAVVPEVYVITAGQEPKVKAYVLQGKVTVCNKFLDASAGANAAEALNKLLIRTQTMLQVNINQIGNHTAKKEVFNSMFPEHGWDSHTFTNPATSFTFDGNDNSSDGSDHSDDSAVGGLGHGRSVFMPRVSGTHPAMPSSFYDAVTDAPFR